MAHTHTMHMCDKYLRDFGNLRVIVRMRLKMKLAQSALGTVDHYSGHYMSRSCTRQETVLHRSPFPSTSATREEQFRVRVGPPPLELPRKVIDIARDISNSEIINRSLGAKYEIDRADTNTRETRRKLELVPVEARRNMYELG